MSKKQKNKQKKTLQRFVTLILGLGFAGSTLFLVVGSLFSQSSNNASNPNTDSNAPSLEEQIEIRAKGYEKVLAREPNNITALSGLAQIYLETGKTDKAIPILEKLVESYPEETQFSSILQILKQQQENKTPEAEGAKNSPK